MKTFFLILIFWSVTVLTAQNFNFGIKGGVNYNFSGDLTDKNELLNTGDDAIHGAKNSLGYHGGIFLKYSISDFFLRTEANFTQYKTEYSVSSNPITLTSQKVDIPLVLGTKVFSKLYVFVGPDFQYQLSEDFSLENTELHYQDFTWGLHAGVGLQLDNFLVEVCWDKPLSDNEINILNSISSTDYYTVDQRPNQLLLSIGYKFD